MDEFDAGGAQLREHLAQDMEGVRMWMPDHDGFSFFSRRMNGAFEFLTDRALLLDIVEKRDIAKSRRYAVAFGGQIGECGCGCTAVDEK